MGRPWGEKLIDFILPGTCLEGPGGALGRHFHSFFAVGPAGAKKVRRMHVLGIVVSSIVYAFSLFLVRLTGGASASAHLENTFWCGRYAKFRVSAIFARNEKAT